MQATRPAHELGYPETPTESPSLSGVTNGTSTSNGRVFSQPNANMIKDVLYAAATSLLTTATSANESIENPTSYEDKVARSRQYWGGKYSNPVVATIMDTMVAACVAFGTENLIKGIAEVGEGEIPEDVLQAKEVVDHWCAVVNAGSPMITPGLDSIRKQAHFSRFRDGGAVIAWTKPESLQTYSGIKYTAPKMMAVFPRTNYTVVPSGTFGGMILTLKDTIELPSKDNPSNTDVNVNTGPDYLTSKPPRYHVFDRMRLESVQQYPDPFLTWRGATNVCARIRTLQRGDFQTAKRVIRAILLFTQGAEKWLDKLEWTPDTVNFNNLITTLSEGGDDSFNNIIGSDYTTKAEWITPDMASMMSADKYKHDDFELMAALGFMDTMNTEQGKLYRFNPKPFLMEFKDAQVEDRRLVENVLFPMLWENNPNLFKSIKPCNFFQKPVTLFWDPEDKTTLIKMFEYGGLTWDMWESAGSGIGLDAEAMFWGRKKEAKAGYDTVFTPRETFRQGVTPQGATAIVDPNPDIITAEENPSLVVEIDDIRDEIKDALTDTETTDEKKRSILKYLLLSAFFAFGKSLEDKQKSIYISQFGDSTPDMRHFKKLAAKNQENLDKFGNELLLGTDRKAGLYSLIGIPLEELDQRLSDILRSFNSRMLLYEIEPYKYAEFSGQAAVALRAGYRFAKRHSAFADTTCELCISLDGTIYAIEEILQGDWDHPTGLCTLEFLKTKL